MQQSLSRKCKKTKPLDSINRSKESDNNSSDSSKSINKVKNEGDHDSLNAFLNRDALMDKENKSSLTSRLFYTRRQSIYQEPTIPAKKADDCMQIDENYLLNDNFELDQIYNSSKFFTEDERDSIEKKQNRIDTTGRACLPCRQSPPCIIDQLMECESCIKPNVLLPAQSEDEYKDLLIRLHFDNGERSRTHDDQGDLMTFHSSSSKSAFHSPSR